jgi:hypothetical protein
LLAEARFLCYSQCVSSTRPNVLQVLNSTSSGEHKFKLTGIFLNHHDDAAYFGKWIMQQASTASNHAARQTELQEARAGRARRDAAKRR